MEGVESQQALDAVDIALKIFDKSGKAAGAGLTISKLFERTELAKRLSKSSLAKGVRVGAVLLSMMPNMASGKSPEAADYLKGVTTIQSMLSAASKQRMEAARTVLGMPSQEAHQSALKKVESALERLRARSKAKPGTPEAVALDFVVSNVLDFSTSTLLKEMLTNEAEHSAVQTWYASQRVKDDFSDVYNSPIMQDEKQRDALINAMHELAEDPDVILMQEVVGDSRLMHNYEVIFRAMHQKEYREKNGERVRNAAQELLKEANLEEVVRILRESNADTFGMQLAGFLSQYAPDSVVVSKYGEDTDLNTDEGFVKLNS